MVLQSWDFISDCACFHFALLLACLLVSYHVLYKVLPYHVCINYFGSPSIPQGPQLLATKRQYT